MEVTVHEYRLGAFLSERFDNFIVFILQLDLFCINIIPKC